MLAALGLAFGLAMDATAVAAARGLIRARASELFVLPLLFAVFQAGMAAIGWAIGEWGGDYIAAWDHWIAFGLLIGIGIKMLVEAIKRDHAVPVGTSAAVYLGLALATSIDAAAAGLTLPLVPVAPWISIVLIGAVSFVCPMIGYAAGRAAGARFGSRLEIVGGLTLIGLAIRLLVEHL
jgi:putative Mn2+ efflux pump MntP